MRRRRHSLKTIPDHSTADDSYFVDAKAKDLIAYWSLLILLRLNGHREFVDKDGDLRNEDLAYFLKLDKYAEESREYERKEVIGDLLNSLKSFEQKETFSTPVILQNNLNKIRQMLQLNQVEIDVLSFTIYIQYYEVFEAAGDTLGNSLATDKVEHILGVLLGYSKSEIKKALSPRSKLARSGLVTMWRTGSQSLKGKLDVLSDDDDR